MRTTKMKPNPPPLLNCPPLVPLKWTRILPGPSFSPSTPGNTLTFSNSKSQTPYKIPNHLHPPLHSSGAISPARMALILPVAASMLAWALLFFFTWVFTVGKLELALPPLVDSHNKRVEKEKRGKKKTIEGDLFDVQNRIVSIIHALLCIAVTAHQIREEGISIGQVNSQLQVFIHAFFPPAPNP